MGQYLAETGDPNPPANVAAQIAKTNASYPTFSPKPGSVRYTPERLNAAGFTMKSGPTKGRVVISTGAEEGHVPNTLAHESLHQRFDEHGNRPPRMGMSGKPLDLDAIGNWPRWELSRRMKDLQPDDQFGPYWGMRANRNGEEQLANIYGYEGSLPKGSAITGTEVGKALFDGRQSLKDYYFSQVSHPYGGLWEGQTPEPSMTSQIADRFKQFLLKRGINFVGNP